MNIITDFNAHTKINNEIITLIDKKIVFFQDIIQKTILYVQKNKILDILGVSDVNNCINTLIELSKQINMFVEKSNSKDSDLLINSLQNINNELSSLFKCFGTESFEDLLWICFGNNSMSSYTSNENDRCKFELLQKYFHPTGYRVLSKPELDKHTKHMLDDQLHEKSRNLDCINIHSNTKSFHLKVYGLQVIVHNANHKKSLIINGVVDDVMLDILNNKFINTKMTQLVDNLPKDEDFETEYFDQFMKCLLLKDYLIYNSQDLYSRYIGFTSNINALKTKGVAQNIKDFLAGDLFSKRLLIMQLLIHVDKFENQYLAYLLYDILSNDTNGSVDTQEQVILFDSFPWIIKQYFRDAMKKTVQYTNDLLSFDIQKVPIEQQICLLNANDNVKEKAIQKLKEVKSKSEDSGSKARQFLDGLLKIPFNIFKKEPILLIMNKIRSCFTLLIKNNKIVNIPFKNNYTSLEISTFIKTLKLDYFSKLNIATLKKTMAPKDKDEIHIILSSISVFIDKHKLEIENPDIYNKKKEYAKNYIHKFIDLTKDNVNLFSQFIGTNISKDPLYRDIQFVENQYNEIHDYMNTVKQTLDYAVHGHEKAKNQISRIIGQWINGEQDGYCFGFEGPPGVGKTSLAKRGLSQCLKDENGISRPFAMIQIGGDSNGSSLHGHNYTYVGSTWGSIVQILMDKKCMNPIIFIDEIDKISKTEHGKEIIGILTHLLDPTQNDSFQDKYFTGIDLDLSKALFILSYNDVSAIDHVLLDRIHRIKFTNLTIEDKLTICKIHILPEVYKKMGLVDMITINEEVLKMIINDYTLEPGVRKLKEILFEIVGEINLDILNNFDTMYTHPIEITAHNVKHKYLKERHPISHKKIFHLDRIGYVNGLWANSMGQGGVIPIQCNFFPAEGFLKLKLTGMQGDVMKESMNVALTLAWKLTCKEVQDKIIAEYKQTSTGIHIHCPEGSVPKDGPSAGGAITATIYSLLNQRKIKHNIGLTGEISLDGYLTEIGGLDLKILGGIKAGITEFIYPKENQKDLHLFLEKYKENDIITGIQFHSVTHINDVFELIFENDII